MVKMHYISKISESDGRTLYYLCLFSYFLINIDLFSSFAGGVFLLLGYSSADEALLRPHTNLGVQDAVRALQQYVTTHIDNQVSFSSDAPGVGKL